jgi:hypothetical protein
MPAPVGGKLNGYLPPVVRGLAKLPVGAAGALADPLVT